MFPSGDMDRGGLGGVVQTAREKIGRSSTAVPLILVGSIAAVVVTAGAISLYNAMDDNERRSGGSVGSGGYLGYHSYSSGGSSFSGGGEGHATGGTSRGGFGGTGHSGGGS